MGQYLVWVVARDHEDGHGYEDEDEDDVCVFGALTEPSLR